MNGRNALRGGSYSLLISVIVLAILVVVNVFASALPTARTHYDISASKLYSITSNTKVVVSGLSDDVTIYWIVQAGKEDAVIENLLGKYESLSDHIKVEKKNPDVYPAFAEQYTDETVKNNSLVVECGDRNRYIPYDDIYLQESADPYSYSYTTSFDGEGAITSAIDYVTNEDFPQLYVLEGHGEAELPQGFSEKLTKENVEQKTLSLPTVDAVPEDADCVMIYAPKSDLSDAETKMLSDYVANGGKLFVAAGPVADGSSLTNLYSLLSDYGVTSEDGIVIEGDRAHYAFGTPYMLLPEMEESEITKSLSDAHYTPVIPLAEGLRIGESTGNGTVTPLLQTSAESFSKKDGYQLTSFEKEEGDAEGPFTLAVSVSDNGGGSIVWFASSEFLEDMYNAYSSGANADLGMNALSSLIGDREAMAIRSKSLNYNYLTISASTSSLLKTLMIGVFPLVYLGVGICVTVRRRKLQNEAV